MMSNEFFKLSKAIANEFLQSIVFIDDKAYEQSDEQSSHEFDALKMTQVFGKSEKICAVYRPKVEQDIEDLAQLSKKADITVLDWQIHIEEDLGGDDEEDVEEDDPRGPHTRKIIREILSDPLTGKGSLKLIIVYTGETILYDITDDIFTDLKAVGIENIERGDCEVYTENIKVLIRAKPLADDDSEEPKFKHHPELNKKVVVYEDLPDFILTEFTKMTAGLLTNFVIQSLTVLRDNVFRLIKLYKKELDPSFLSHRLLLPDPHDSKEHLVEILSHSIQALLNYNETGDAVSISRIKKWIDSQDFNQSLTVENNKELTIDSKFIKDWISNSFVDASTNQWVDKGFGDAQNAPDGKFRRLEKQFIKKASEYFVGANNGEIIDSEFSILTHHKSNLKQPTLAPKLTLGSLIKQMPKRSKDSGRYFLCIQARCDSVRINDARKFLFLPLEVAESNSIFHFVAEDNENLIRLKIKKDAFEIRTIKFIPRSGKNSIIAYKSKGNYYFKSNHEERFKWLADLKDAHAQREVNKYAAQISRVGLDESEWLRRWSTLK